MNREPIEHELKTWPEYFQAVKNGFKRFEFRKADRDYQVGDMLLLREYAPDLSAYTGDETRAEITYILTGFGLPEGTCILSISQFTDELIVHSGPFCCLRCTPKSGKFPACRICGNKRCPHATFHLNRCTGSNEPGQPGSDYK